MYSTYLWSRNDIAVLCLIAKARHEGTVLCILARSLVRPDLSITIVHMILMNCENLNFEYWCQLAH